MYDALCFGDAVKSLAEEGYATIRVNDVEYSIDSYADSDCEYGVKVVLLRLTDSVNLLSANDLDDLVAVVER